VGHGVSPLGTSAAFSPFASEHGVGRHVPRRGGTARLWVRLALAPTTLEQNPAQKNHVNPNVGDLVFLVCLDGTGCVVQF